MDGVRGSLALEQTIESAFLDRALCQIRSVEEHYLRKSGKDRSANVRARLQEAVQHASFGDVVRAIAQGARTARRFEPSVRDGLDDGVQLCPP